MERVVSGPPRRMVLYLAGLTLLLSIGGGFLANLLSPQDYNGFGEAIWWAVVTFMTVGYGDVVPVSPEGRLVGTFIMVGGITTVAAFTALVTASFVSAKQGRADAFGDRPDAELVAALDRVTERLDAIESRLQALGSSGAP
jgi:voltage-gated potassium channel Kch